MGHRDVIVQMRKVVFKEAKSGAYYHEVHYTRLLKCSGIFSGLFWITFLLVVYSGIGEGAKWRRGWGDAAM